MGFFQAQHAKPGAGKHGLRGTPDALRLYPPATCLRVPSPQGPCPEPQERARPLWQRWGSRQAAAQELEPHAGKPGGPWEGWRGPRAHWVLLGRGQPPEFQMPRPGRLMFQEAAPRTPAGRGQRSWNFPQGLNWRLSSDPGREEVKIEGRIAQSRRTLSSAWPCSHWAACVNSGLTPALGGGTANIPPFHRWEN